ncbi:hypothetical protein JCM24511_07996 [Saitozyma sp. JCM 24511]|nr:hypothetical protein JCM24511_07996 [Saitozyma sp. JCM 24511]
MSTSDYPRLTVCDAEGDTRSLVEALGLGNDSPLVQPTLRKTSTFSKNAATFTEERIHSVRWTALVTYTQTIQYIAKFNRKWSHSPGVDKSEWIQDILKQTFRDTQDTVVRSRQKHVDRSVWRGLSDLSDEQVGSQSFVLTEAPSFLELPFHESALSVSGGEPNLEIAEEMREIDPDEAAKGWNYGKQFNGARSTSFEVELSDIEIIPPA